MRRFDLHYSLVVAPLVSCINQFPVLAIVMLRSSVYDSYHRDSLSAYLQRNAVYNRCQKCFKRSAINYDGGPFEIDCVDDAISSVACRDYSHDNKLYHHVRFVIVSLDLILMHIDSGRHGRGSTRFGYPFRCCKRFLRGMHPGD